jgi:hypothetical protein
MTKLHSKLESIRAQSFQSTKKARDQSQSLLMLENYPESCYSNIIHNFAIKVYMHWDRITKFKLIFM